MDTSILRRLRGKPKVRRIATIDIEARNWVEPYAVGFYDGSKYVDFVDYTFTYQAIDRALEYVLRPEYAGHWIYAHNGGNYDFTFFLRRLLLSKEIRSKYLIDIIPIGSTVVCFTVVELDPGVHRAQCDDNKCRGCKPKKRDDREQKWLFLDSARLMPLALEDIGNTFKTTKKVKLQMSYDELAKQANEKTMRHYMKVDCVSLYDAVDRLQTTINNLGGQIGMTLPATSMDLFRRVYQKDDIYTNRHWLKCPNHGRQLKRGERQPECPGSTEKHRIHSCLHEFIREAYFGGRTEIYRMTFEPYYDKDGVLVDTANLYDINSHYPHCMLEPMPIGPAVEMNGLTEDEVYYNARRLIGIVDCDVYIPEDCYLPPLPVKTEEGAEGKLIFPTGYLRGTWDTAELTLLPKVGGKILRTRRSVWFETSPVFVRFIRQLYKFRDKSDPNWNEGLDWIAKLLMNSLYGKWGMKEHRTKIVIHPSSPQGKKCINFESDVWAEDTFVSPVYIIPQLSVHVTSVARARLWEANFGVLKAGGRIYYNDTDSLVCAGATLATGTALGAMKHEATIKRAVFALPKLYLIETEEVQKKKTEEKHLKIKAKGMGPGIRVAARESLRLIDEELRKLKPNQSHKKGILMAERSQLLERIAEDPDEELGDDPLAGQLSETEFFDLVRRGVPILRHRITKLVEALNEYARKATEFPRIVSTPKSMQSKYDKRRILDDYDTVPLNLVQFDTAESGPN